MHIYESAENYLEAILIIQERRGSVRSIDIANELNFSKPSVSVAMKKLRKNGYIEMDSDGYITRLHPPPARGPRHRGAHLRAPPDAHGLLPVAGRGRRDRRRRRLQGGARPQRRDLPAAQGACPGGHGAEKLKVLPPAPCKKSPGQGQQKRASASRRSFSFHTSQAGQTLTARILLAFLGSGSTS